jgi:hypothetical protein
MGWDPKSVGVIGVFIGDKKDDLYNFLVKHISTTEVKNDKYIKFKYSCDHLNEEDKKFLDENIECKDIYCGKCGSEKRINKEPNGAEILYFYSLKGLNVKYNGKEIKSKNLDNLKHKLSYLSEEMTKECYPNEDNEIEIVVDEDNYYVRAFKDVEYGETMGIYIVYSDNDLVLNDDEIAGIQNFSRKMKILFPDYETVSHSLVF